MVSLGGDEVRLQIQNISQRNAQGMTLAAAAHCSLGV
jgi:hypothetical protein